MTAARLFSRSVTSAFYKDARSNINDEVQLFDALIDALGSTRSSATVRMHGSFLTSFDPNDSNLVRERMAGMPIRSMPSCELCDVAVIAFDILSCEIRLTFVQVKLERTLAVNCLKHAYDANPEQWLLLGRRPLLTKSPLGAGNDLLKQARIPSIGSYLMFHKKGKGMRRRPAFYSAADLLKPVLPCKAQSGRLVRTKYNRIETSFAPDMEITYTKNLPMWVAALYDMQIGESLKQGISSAAANWIRSLNAAMRSSPTISRDVMEKCDQLDAILGPPTLKIDAQQSGEGGMPKAIVIIQSERKFNW